MMTHPKESNRRVAVAKTAWPTDHRERWARGLQAPVNSEGPSLARFKNWRRTVLVGSAQGELERPRLIGKPAVRQKARKPQRHPSAWSPSTVANAEYGWSMWLGWCTTCDLHDQADTITLERVARYIEFHLGRGCASKTIADYVEWLLLAARVMYPERDSNWLAAEVSFLKKTAKPVRDKLAKLIPIEELARHAEELMDEADRRPISVHTAVLYRDALIIATLAWRPKRIGNIGRISLSENCRFDRDGKLIGFEFARTKNGRPTEPPVPDRLRKRFIKYFADYRPILNIKGADELWPSMRGNALSPHQIGKILRRRVKIGPHAFRHAYATSMGAADLCSREAVQIMLDHTDGRSISFYEPIARSSYASRRLEEEGNQLLIEPPARRRLRLRRRKHTGLGARSDCQRQPTSATSGEC